MTDDPPLHVLEADFQREIVGIATEAGFSFIRHETDSRRSDPGPADLLLLRLPDPRWTPREIHAEVKAATGRLRRGRFTKRGRWLPGQDEWKAAHEAIMRAAREMGGFVPEYYLWRAGRTWRGHRAVVDEIRSILWRGHCDDPTRV